MRVRPGPSSSTTARCIDEHGFLEDPVPWTLDPDKDVREERKKAKEQENKPKEMTCPQCMTVFKGRRDCPSCGYAMVAPNEKVPVHEAELKEKKDVKAKRHANMLLDQKMEVLGGLKHYAITKGYKVGWAKHKYRDIFGEFPAFEARPCPPNQFTKGQITYLNIKNARRRASA